MRWWVPIQFLILPTMVRAQADPLFADRCVHRYATHYRVPPELIAALIDVESRWNSRALYRVRKHLNALTCAFYEE